MVLVVSDNGGTAAAYPSNAPFSGAKASYREGGVRTPLILSWPGHWEGGEARDRITMIFDLYPSILAALGIPAPANLDGTDIFAKPSHRVLHWYSHYAPGSDVFSVLSADGQWRLNTWAAGPEVVQELYHHSNFLLSNPDPKPIDDPALAQSLGEPAQAWFREVTRVDGLSATDLGPWREYSQDAFRRTPMLGAHSMGFVFRADSHREASDEPRTLVAQEGYIAIREHRDELQIEVDGQPLAVAFPGAENRCRSVVISSILSKNNMVFFGKSSTSSIGVYVDGEPVLQSSFRNPELSRASPRNPLRVRIGAEQGWSMPRSSRPILSTRFFQAEEVRSSIHPELIESCNKD